MSDNRRRRYRRGKQDESEKRPTIILKREEERRPSSSANTQRSDPKIILKTKSEPKDEEVSEIIAVQAPQRTIIVTRSDATQSPASLGTSPNHMKEQAQGLTSGDSVTQGQLVMEPTPQMTRPATVVSSTGYANAGTRKLMLKNNTDFLVVGVIGTQGVGKSTIMNILANEDVEYNYYEKIFVEEDSFFPTKLKQQKCSSRSRTESTHMFITKDRLILLDSPPVLCNSYKKDMTTNELDDIRNIITFLSVCHLLIVVQDDYLNMSFMRLLQIAELMKPPLDNKAFANDYFPNLLFIKNRAKHSDFAKGQKACMDKMLLKFFKDSQMRILIGQTVEQQRQKQKKSSRVPEVGDQLQLVNSFLFPEVTGPEATSYHDSLASIIDKLRSLVFMTPRNDIHSGLTEFTEETWFELLIHVAQNTQNFFFKTYEDIHRKHLDGGVNSQAMGTGNSGNETGGRNHENWRD